MIIFLINNGNEVNLYLMFLTLILVFVFISKNLFIFFFFFEFSLIPIFLLIKKWGNYIERINASFYLLLYTLFFSFPLLLMLFYYIKFINSIEYTLIYLLYCYKLNIFEFLFFILAFLVKMPIFLLHFWLPKAHVEAPVFGSIYLARIILKLGRFGLIRIINLFTFDDKNFFIRISLLGIIFIGLNCLRVVDIKVIVAYSSVIHINIIIASIFSFSILGFIGSYIIIISHGLISSGIFFIVNEFYLMRKSRLFKFNKGILNLVPSGQLFWFLLCRSNIGVPISLNFIREVFLLISLISYIKIFFLFFFIIIILNSFYNLFLYMYISHIFGIIKNKLNFTLNSIFIILIH